MAITAGIVLRYGSDALLRLAAGITAIVAKDGKRSRAERALDVLRALRRDDPPPPGTRRPFREEAASGLAKAGRVTFSWAEQPIPRGGEMAQTIAVTVTCDICGSAKDAQTRRISLDGQAREIDLCGKDARALDKVAAKSCRTPGRSAGPPPPAAGLETGSAADIREWARIQGYELSDRGRIPASIEAEYEAAH